MPPAADAPAAGEAPSGVAWDSGADADTTVGDAAAKDAGDEEAEPAKS
jgi:hypothetical protein